MNEREFRHYGVKGQKWGIRRTLTQLGYKNRQRNTNSNREDLTKLSDDELHNRINRMRLENKYLELSPHKVSTGKTFVDKVIKPSLTDSTKRILTDFIVKKGKEAIGISG